MASDSRAGLRAEIDAAIAVIQPLIRGLETLRTAPALGAASKDEVNAELEDEKRRRTLLQNVIKELDDLDAAIAGLEADGYPEDPKEIVSAPVMADLQAELAALQAAFGEFVEEPKITVTFGAPVPK